MNKLTVVPCDECMTIVSREDKLNHWGKVHGYRYPMFGRCHYCNEHLYFGVHARSWLMGMPFFLVAAFFLGIVVTR